MEHIKKCLDTMAISTPGTPLSTAAETDKWICMQWIFLQEDFKKSAEGGRYQVPALQQFMQHHPGRDSKEQAGTARGEAGLQID